MLSFSVIVSLLVIVLSVSGKIGQGLLVGVLVAAYATYMTWSALSSYPNPTKAVYHIVNGKNVSTTEDLETCNPFLCDPTKADASCNIWTMVVGIAFSALSIGWTGWRTGLASTRLFRDPDANTDSDDSNSLLANEKNSYGSNSKAKKDQAKLDKVLTGEVDAADIDEDPENIGNDSNEHEKKFCCGCQEQMGRLFFYVVLTLASFYVAMLLTNWSNSSRDGTSSEQIGVGYTSMWVQFGFQWFMVALYIWSLIAPHVCSCRDFS